jgi:putative hemolysin
MDIAISILVTLLLTVINGYFSMAEMAISTAKKAVLEHEHEEQGDLRSAAAARASENPEPYLAAIQVAITLVGFASSAFAATNLSDPFASWMGQFGLNRHVAVILAPVLITLAVSYVSIVVGELVPKRIALANAETVAKLLWLS